MLLSLKQFFSVHQVLYYCPLDFFTPIVAACTLNSFILGYKLHQLLTNMLVCVLSMFATPLHDRCLVVLVGKAPHITQVAGVYFTMYQACIFALTHQAVFVRGLVCYCHLLVHYASSEEKFHLCIYKSVCLHTHLDQYQCTVLHSANSSLSGTPWR